METAIKDKLISRVANRLNSDAQKLDTATQSQLSTSTNMMLIQAEKLNGAWIDLSDRHFSMKTKVK